MANAETPVVVNVNNQDTDALQDAITHIPEIVKESKAGYKTTEFWLTVVLSILTVVNAIPLPEKYEGAVVAALGIAYALSRGFAKKGIPDVQPVPVAIAPVSEIVQREEGDALV